MSPHLASPASSSTSPDLRLAYGLRIRSAVPLPELPAWPDTGETADLVISCEPARPVAEPYGATFDDNGVRLAWPAVGAFRIDDRGEGIVVTPTREASADLLAFPLLGPVLACAMHLRGRFVLHASAIAVGDRAVAIMGDKGAGKSSTACALLRAGHALLADDLVVANPVAEGFVTPPGCAQMKLDAPALARLDDPLARVLPPAHPSVPKSRVLVGRFRDRPAPLARLFVLSRGGEAAIVPLAGEEALRAVLRFAYVARFGQPALAQGRAGAHLRRAAELADAGLVHRLVVPDGLDRLPEAVAAIEADLARAAVSRAESVA
ncbi:serine kinase [Salinarimonas ramus]|uniref:HPr kinase n=1 Tax=Salinarimonas ramus TaxID=690164 RepID=A0A917V516_9HYPH|nr:serine kinase [Salinarimonas ramus]GGK37745.1 HPr kinase [Salinarimonas ramus]